MATYKGSVSFSKHISVEADDEDEAQERMEKRAEWIAKKRKLKVMDIVDVTEI